MTIYVCRVDGNTFWSEDECHYHVDFHHREWGHAVCVRGGPTPFECTICNMTFDSKQSCENHLTSEHHKTGDLTSMWTIVTSDS